jgi:5-methylcytosine-specific restriction endonuclease McrA
MSRSWAAGSTPRWRRIRAQVLHRNVLEHGGRCQVALPWVCQGQADQVHHTMGRQVTGDDPAYLVATCRACNLAIGEPGRSPQTKRVSSW